MYKPQLFECGLGFFFLELRQGGLFAAILERDVGIRFKGVEKNNVEEYCVSEGWIRVAAGTAKDRLGNPLTIKLTGKVEPYFREKKAER